MHVDVMLEAALLAKTRAAEKMVTADLSKNTLQPWSKSFPTLTRLCWREGMMLASRTGRCSSRRLPWEED